ncbi:MAG: hypothetical protein VKL42_13690 [Snowella sp.]|nr:hypothetical protein [Snowella sp.]
MTSDLDTSDPNIQWETIEDTDIVDLFKLAEEIQKNRDFYNDKLDKLYLSRDVVLIVSLFMLGLWLLPIIINNHNFLTNLQENLSRIVIGFMFFYILWMLLGVIFNSHIKKIKRKLRSEQYTLEETVDLLREIEPMLHYRHSNHGLKKIEFKLRLSRFNIGQKYEEPTSILHEILNLNKNKE